MGLAFAAEVGQRCSAEIAVQADDYGLSETFLQDTLDTPEVRRAIRAGANEALLRHIGQAVLATTV